MNIQNVCNLISCYSKKTTTLCCTLSKQNQTLVACVYQRQGIDIVRHSFRSFFAQAYKRARSVVYIFKGSNLRIKLCKWFFRYHSIVQLNIIETHIDNLCVSFSDLDLIVDIVLAQCSYDILHVIYTIENCNYKINENPFHQCKLLYLLELTRPKQIMNCLN